MPKGGQKLYLGGDLGATNLRVAVVAEDGEIRIAERIALEDRTPSAVAAEMAKLMRQVLEESGQSFETVAGVGVGVAGQIAGESGLVLVGPNLGWRDVLFGALLEREIGRRPRIVNDLSAAAWGESRVGAARGATDLVLVFVGSGVGGGLVLGGRLHEGAGGIAGEVGHVKIQPGGLPCGCGERGCIEAYVGGHNIARRLRELCEAGKGKAILAAAGGDPEELSGAALEEAAEAGDPEAIELRGEMGRQLGWVVGNLVTVLNPQKLILGGGVLFGMPGLLRETTDWIHRIAGRQQLQQVSILAPALGDDAGLIGAALLAHG